MRKLEKIFIVIFVSLACITSGIATSSAISIEKSKLEIQDENSLEIFQFYGKELFQFGDNIMKGKNN